MKIEKHEPEQALGLLIQFASLPHAIIKVLGLNRQESVLIENDSYQERWLFNLEVLRICAPEVPDT